VVDQKTIRWSTSSDMYVEIAIVDIKQHLSDIGGTLVEQRRPIFGDYRPESDGTSKLIDYFTNYYQGLIGDMRWATGLGILDILCLVSLMSSCMVAPRSGHLNQLFHIIGYSDSHSLPKWSSNLR
jgi:hypothetical protein